MSAVSGQLDQPTLVTGAPSEGVPKKLAIWILLGAAGLLLCSSVRHYLLRSGAMDLGVFDQAVYLISAGETPICTLLGYHILGDHASFALYPYSLVYLIWPDAYMLLAVQAVVLAAGAYPVWRLARLGRAPQNLCAAVVAAYLMCPLILTSNLHDFHPEVLVVGTLLMAVLAAREDRRGAFVFWILLTLTPKEIMSITVAATGLYLLIIEKRRFCGLFALLAGAMWFVIAAKFVIPYFGNGKSPSGIGFYSYLGQSIGEILSNCLFHPGLWLPQLASPMTVIYLMFILLPMWWAVHPRTILPLLAATPAILLNLLSSFAGQHMPLAQYMLPIIPFMFVAMADAAATQRIWLRKPTAIVGWSISILVIGAGWRLTRLQTDQAGDFQTLADVKHAISLVPPSAAVLTTFEITPRLTHRKAIDYIGNTTPRQPADQFDYILINSKSPSLLEPESAAEFTSLVNVLQTSGTFEAVYTAPNVSLYHHLPSTKPSTATAGFVR